jgi:hypothetical protein
MGSSPNHLTRSWRGSPIGSGKKEARWSARSTQTLAYSLTWWRIFRGWLIGTSPFLARAGLPPSPRLPAERERRSDLRSSSDKDLSCMIFSKLSRRPNTAVAGNQACGAPVAHK